MANDIKQFPSESGVSPEERGTSTQPFVIAQAGDAGPNQNPWSRYIPFAKGTDLLVERKMSLIIADFPFSGSAKIDELTDAQLGFSVRIPPPAFFKDDFADVLIAAKITYVAEGSSNTAVFSINGKETPTKVDIHSKTDERVLTPPGGLKIPTGLPFPAPDKVEIREVRMIPAKDHLEIRVGMAAPIPSFTISVSKRQ
jgi:hypothetical protein